jgi:SAM-dependent methyltransferase
MQPADQQSWTSGYVADIGYTYGYYSELNPQRVRLAFLSAGLAFPEMGAACELGFGQGLSANIHAAASTCAWSGTDFNPAQAGFARELSIASGSGANLMDESFAEFSSRDLPDFDYIGLHGIWSWISDQNRSVIVDFIRRKLKVGGVLYISYNTLPGWGAFAPMRHLMTEHAEINGSEGRGIVSRINDAIEFTERLLVTSPLYARANPQIAERIKKLKQQNRHYLAHEYFNRDWHPMHFATMARWLEPAKLQFACSAHTIEHLDAINLSKEQQNFLSQIPDLMFRQTVRDFMVNQQFRKDYWVKGARRVSAYEQRQMLENTRVVLTTPRTDVPMTITTTMGIATLSDAVYGPMLDALGKHESKTLKELQTPEITLGNLLEASLLLMSAGHLAMAQDVHTIKKVTPVTTALNRHLCSKAQGTAEISFLASPVTGGGIPAGRFEQLFLREITQGNKDPQQWAKVTWALLKAQGQRLVKEGKPLESDDDNLAELSEQAEEFSRKRLAMMSKLGVIEA